MKHRQAELQATQTPTGEEKRNNGRKGCREGGKRKTERRKSGKDVMDYVGNEVGKVQM